MDQTKPVEYPKRRKTLFGGRIVISAAELDDIEDDLAVTEARVAQLRVTIANMRAVARIREKITDKLLGRINVMAGKIPAPLCPKCGKPKIAGGIQWIDHAACYAGKSKGKSQNAKI